MANALMGKRIRTQRLRLGLTQEQLAEKAKMSISFLGHIERGTRVASMATMIRISRELRVSLDWITGLYDTEDLYYGYPREQMEKARELLLLALSLMDK